MRAFTRQALFSTALLIASLAGCSSSSTTSISGPDGGPDGGTSSSSSVGVACVPSAESTATYRGGDAIQIGLDVNAPVACGACLINHFQGRVTCPYGQDATGKALSGSAPCVVPGTNAPVTVAVPAQCTDRKAESAVYCSCRCANTAGKTDDGATYCGCPQGFACTQVAPSLGQPNDTTSGAYCVKDGTAYDKASACSATCDAMTTPCP